MQAPSFLAVLVTLASDIQRRGSRCSSVTAGGSGWWGDEHHEQVMPLEVSTRAANSAVLRLSGSAKQPHPLSDPFEPRSGLKPRSPRVAISPRCPDPEASRSSPSPRITRERGWLRYGLEREEARKASSKGQLERTLRGRGTVRTELCWPCPMLKSLSWSGCS